MLLGVRWVEGQAEEEGALFQGRRRWIGLEGWNRGCVRFMERRNGKECVSGFMEEGTRGEGGCCYRFVGGEAEETRVLVPGEGREMGLFGVYGGESEGEGEEEREGLFQGMRGLFQVVGFRFMGRVGCFRFGEEREEYFRFRAWWRFQVFGWRG